MMVNLAVIAMLLSAGVNVLALAGPFLAIRSELELLRFQVKELSSTVKRLSRRVFEGVDDRGREE